MAPPRGAKPPPPPPKAEARRGKKRAAAAADAGADADADAAPAPLPPPSKKRDKQPQPAPAYWLVKSEPHEYSVDDLAANKGGGRWDGVRNYAARNHMRAMRRGDLCLFYHSSCAVPCVVAIAKVTTDEAYPDPTAAEKGRYYDEKHTPEAPRWWCVDLALERRLAAGVTLSAIKRKAEEKDDADGRVLSGMALLTRPRLSVQPVTPEEWAAVMRMEAAAAAAATEEENEGAGGGGGGGGGGGAKAGGGVGGRGAAAKKGAPRLRKKD